MTNPRFPLYIVSYGRAENARTPRFFEKYDIPYSLVIESVDVENYTEYFDEDKLLVVPQEYHDDYETFDGLGQEKPQGPGPARNFAWEHAIGNGYDFHWVMDDNISRFIYYTENYEVTAGTGAIFRAMEDFVLQYENIAMAGPRYQMFNIKKDKTPPITPNTRVYSCNLIRNDVPFRWAGRYNEDTDLSLRILKEGYATVLFNLFLQKKAGTQRLSGGNTANFYEREGTYNKSKMLKQRHPDVTKLTRKWGRWHHHVNYQPFKSNSLVPKDDPEIEVGEYDFKVVPREDTHTNQQGANS